MAKLSAYELEREANIARNKALLQQLELKQAVESLPSTSKVRIEKKAKPIQPKSREKRKREPEPEAPRRQSARLRRSHREEEEQRQKEEEARLAAEEARRQAQKPRHNKLDMIALVENGPEDMQSLNKAMETIPHTSIDRIGDFDAYVFDDSKEEERAVEDLRKRMSKMVVKARAKVTGNRIYSAAYHPEVTKDLIFFGVGHLGCARALDDEEDGDGELEPNEDREGGKYWRIQLHWPATPKSSISCVKLDPIDAHNIFTSSYDTTVRSLSFTTGQSREIFSTENLVNCIDVAPHGNELWISDSQGWVTHLDPREGKGKPRSYALSDNKVGSVSINPTRPHYIVTASNTRYIKVWDVRKLKAMPEKLGGASSVPDGADASVTVDFHSETVQEYLQTKKGRGGFRAEFLHGKSATAAYWDPRGRQILSTSYDDTLRLWDLNASTLDGDEPFKKFQPFSRIKHNTQTGKWVSLLKAQWTRNPDVYPFFTIGNMNHSLDIYSCKGELIQRLSDPRRISAVQAVTASHPNIIERIATGNASGRCVLWAPEDVE
ncbi:hypothetical protein NMY22_g12562 [Coprinellus aureogranulatus]|nr:hypothetical protein NMY22_g12562 [Coprinellus aureogranulatus]